MLNIGLPRRNKTKNDETSNIVRHHSNRESEKVHRRGHISNNDSLTSLQSSYSPSKRSAISRPRSFTTSSTSDSSTNLNAKAKGYREKERAKVIGTLEDRTKLLSTETAFLRREKKEIAKAHMEEKKKMEEEHLKELSAVKMALGLIIRQPENEEADFVKRDLLVEAERYIFNWSSDNLYGILGDLYAWSGPNQLKKPNPNSYQLPTEDCTWKWTTEWTIVDDWSYSVSFLSPIWTPTPSWHSLVRKRVCQF